MSPSLDVTTDEYGRKVNEFVTEISRDKSIENVLILINSENEPSVQAGAFLAAMMGKMTCSIFEDIKHLIHHPVAKIRAEIMECFLECATTGADVLEMAMGIEDQNRYVRLKTLNYLKFIPPIQINSAIDFTKSANNEYHVLFDIIDSDNQKSYSDEELKSFMSSSDTKQKIFMFSRLEKNKTDLLLMSELADLSQEDDIVYYYREWLEGWD